MTELVSLSVQRHSRESFDTESEMDQHDVEKRLVSEGSHNKAMIPRWILTGNDAKRRFNIGLSEKDAINVLCVLLNTVSAVAIVFANKIDPQFRKFQIGTAAWHFTATSVLLYVATLKPFSFFKPVRLAVRDVLPLSTLFVGFLVLGNLSLALNTVSFYQLAKIMTTPTVVAINFVLFGTRLPTPLLVAIMVSCLGVALTNVAMVSSNPTGSLVAIAAFVTTAFYQIWIGKKVHELDISAPALLLNQAPISVVMLLVLLPFTDTIPDFWTVDPKILATFLFSGILAAGLNLSQFLIIGRLSALAFNVVSNAKNVIIIALGWYVAGQAPSIKDVLGVMLALGGAGAYSWLQRR
ncbi:Solute carrier family 35 member E3 [Fonsecaea pedrosoi]|nr:Solute carrier family 35 member E3 [Fonsecaea pedrosoi]